MRRERFAASGRPASTDDVLLRFHGDNGDVDVLARLDGSGYSTETGGMRLFTRANVTPWVVDGAGLYLSGGQVGNAIGASAVAELREAAVTLVQPSVRCG